MIDPKTESQIAARLLASNIQRQLFNAVADDRGLTPEETAEMEILINYLVAQLDASK